MTSGVPDSPMPTATAVSVPVSARLVASVPPPAETEIACIENCVLSWTNA